MADVRICTVNGCGKRREKRTFCNAHYLRWRRHGDPLSGAASPTHKSGGPCSVESCQGTARNRGFCTAHYLKLRRHGNPLVGKTRPPGPSRREWLDKNALSWADREQCLIFPFGLSSGYGMASLEDGELIGSHRYVCEAEHGPPPSPLHETAHSCGNRACVSRWHVRWATRDENAADKLLHGTDPRGEKNGMAKLTRPEVDEIIRLRGIETGTALADRFGVTPAQISNIQLGKQWAYDS